MEHLKYAEILKENVLLAEHVKEQSPYVIKVLSNITCNQLEHLLTYNLRQSGLNPLVSMGNYDNIIQDSYNCGEASLVVVHYDIANIIDKYDDFIESFTKEQFSSLLNTVKSDIDLILDNLRLVPAVVFNSFSSTAIYTNSLIDLGVEQFSNDLNEYLY